jgi:hypothetical protein
MTWTGLVWLKIGTVGEVSQPVVLSFIELASYLQSLKNNSFMP